MTKKQIAELLRAWSRSVLRCEDLRDQLPADAATKKWVGEAPATPEALTAAETRIGRKLPREYRAFLELSNGWRFFDQEGRHLLPVEQVNTLERLDPELVSAYVEPLVEAGLDHDDDEGLPASHYPGLVRISENQDGFYLLDPRDRVPGGWAARFFANWIPGPGEAMTFAELLESRYEEFLSSRGLTTSGTPRRRSLNLKVPPKVPTSDPAEFLRRLTDMGYFDRTPHEIVDEMSSAFLDACQRVKSDPSPAVRRNTAPMRELLRRETGRLAWLETDGLVNGGVPYAVRQMRQVLAERGVELPPAEETRGEISWDARLGKTAVAVCRMKNGKPRGLGMEHDENVAQAVVNAVAILLNRHLRDAGTDLRVACASDYDTTSVPDLVITHGLLALTDELSYELMWCVLGGCYCRVMRPDVFA